MQKKIVKFFGSLSTVPRRRSYVWKDGHASFLSFIILWGLCICRVISLLQLVKWCYRKFTRRKSTDKGSKRVNVPVAVVELYYSVWLVGYILFCFFGVHTIWTRVLAYYFIFESTVWILYYFIFRRFFEENYKINHVLEYFVTLLVLIPAQALAFSECCHITFLVALKAVLGIENADGYFLINYVGILYQVIVIAMIINAFPSEATHVTSGSLNDHIIVGAGDVVQKRLLPELRRKQETVLAVFSKDEGDSKIEECTYLSGTDAQISEQISEEIKKTSTDNSIIWIETITSSHKEYLEKLINVQYRLLAVEKPISDDPDELEWVNENVINSEYGDRVFFLNYYVLEKALPVTYFFSDNKQDFFSKYLNVKKNIVDTGIQLPGKFKISKIKVKIIEGEDQRKWVMDQVCETFIHNILIASNIAGTPDKWKDVVWEKREKNEIKLFAKAKVSESDIDIDLYLKKNAGNAELERYILIYIKEPDLVLYENIDTEILYWGKEKKNREKKPEEKPEDIFEEIHEYISVKRSYRKKYAILSDLVLRAASGEFKSSDVDGRESQLECLKWLINTKEGK